MNAAVIERQDGESDASFRARRVNPEEIGTPRAMLAAIDRVLAPFGYSGVAYYIELPDDEPVIFSAAESSVDPATGEIIGNTDGWYLDVTGPGCIEAAPRHYDARGRCRPRHALLWGLFNDPETTRRLGALAGPDYSDAFCGWGHTVFAIPPFPTLDEADSQDFFITPSLWFDAGRNVNTRALVDDDGNLTAGALVIGTDAPEIFSEADAESDPDGMGSCLFEGTTEAALVTSTIASILEERMDFPSQFTIMLDPELV